MIFFYINIKFKGALTEKPYNFTFRPWETAKYRSFDITDGSNLALQIFLKNNEILRILATSNINLNEEWLSDKSKYIYDSLYINRLNNNSLRYHYSSNFHFTKFKQNENILLLFLIKITIKSFIEIFLVKNNYSQINYKFSDHDDIKFIFSSLNYLNKNNFQTAQKSNSFKFINFYKNSFILKNLINSKGAFCFLINPKFEAWILNYKLLNIFRKKNYTIIGINNSLDYNLKYNNIGISLNFFLKILLNKLIITKNMFEHNTAFLFFTSDQFLNIKNNKILYFSYFKLTNYLKYNFNYNLNYIFVPATLHSFFFFNNNQFLNTNFLKYKKLNFFNDLNSSFSNNIFNLNILYYSQLNYSIPKKASFFGLKKYSILEKIIN